MSDTPKHILQTVQTPDKAVYFRDEMKHFDRKVTSCGVIIISASLEIPRLLRIRCHELNSPPLDLNLS